MFRPKLAAKAARAAYKARKCYDRRDYQNAAMWQERAAVFYIWSWVEE